MKINMPNIYFIKSIDLAALSPKFKLCKDFSNISSTNLPINLQFNFYRSLSVRSIMAETLFETCNAFY